MPAKVAEVSARHLALARAPCPRRSFAAVTPADVRRRLVEALEADLVGPFVPDAHPTAPPAPAKKGRGRKAPEKQGKLF
jgi:hypothetical protein